MITMASKNQRNRLEALHTNDTPDSPLLMPDTDAREEALALLRFDDDGGCQQVSEPP